MSRKVRRGIRRQRRQKGVSQAESRANLQLESLEHRLLLDVAGWWDELGWRSATGGGITWDTQNDTGEVELVKSVDGDAVAIWVDGVMGERVDTPVPFHWQVSGNIYARHYVDDPEGDNLGWWDMDAGGGDTALIGTGSQIAAAAGPNGEIVVAWVAQVAVVNPTDSSPDTVTEIYVKMWDGEGWIELGNSASFHAQQQVVLPGQEPPADDEILQESFGVSDDGAVQREGMGLREDVVNEKPSLAINEAGEIFISYTAIHPVTSQREIVVKMYSLNPPSSQAGPVAATQEWVELVNDGVGEFIADPNQTTGGVSNDIASSYDSAITVDLQGKPIVVWTSALAQDKAEIYVKRWDGNSWEELGLGSASDVDGDGNSGVSNAETQAIQPDIAVAGNGDVIVTWVNWNNWDAYDTNGQAGIHVKVLPGNSPFVWQAYAAGSATGAGIAPQVGWYFSPDIDIDSNNNPFIAWQGVGDSETVNFTDIFDTALTTTQTDMAVYASHFSDASNSFVTLTTAGNLRNTVNDPFFLGFMPDVMVGTNDELILAYTWSDGISGYSSNSDDEVYAVQWDSGSASWVEYGRGGASNGNDVFGGYPAFLGDEIQVGLIDYGSPTVSNVMVAVPDGSVNNGGHLYLYDRTTDSWSAVIDTVPGSPNRFGFGEVFDLRGEPEAEYNVNGRPVLAYLDDVLAQPYVYSWTGSGWTLVGNGPAGPSGTLRPEGISVQQGPNGTILLAYIKNDSISDKVVTRLWTGTQWTNAGGGTLATNEPLDPVYYADFDGFDFTNDSLEDDTDGTTERVLGGWYFVDDSDYVTIYGNLVETQVEGGIDEESGQNAPGDNGVVMTFNVIPAVLPNGSAGEAFGPGGANTGAQFIDGADPLVGRVEHQFELINEGHFILELAYDLDAIFVPNADIDLDLYVDDTKVWDVATILFDDPNKTTGYQVRTFDSGSAPSLLGGPLTAGVHTLSMRASVTAAEPGNPDTVFAYPDAATGMDGWVVNNNPLGANPAAATVAFDAGSNQPIPGDPTGGVLMTLNNAAAGVVGANTTAQMEYDFYLGGAAGEVTISFSYDVFMNSGVSDRGADAGGAVLNEVLTLEVLIDDGTGEQSIWTVENIAEEADVEQLVPGPGFIIVGQPTNPEADWQEESFDLTFDLSAATVNKLIIRAYLTNQGGTNNGTAGQALIMVDNISILGEQQAFVRMDNMAVYQRAVNSAFVAPTPTNGWEFTPQGGNTGGNGAVGPLGLYDFQGNLHIDLTAGESSYTVSGIHQEDNGQMVISFRYRYSPDSTGVVLAGDDTFVVHIDDPLTVGMDYSFPVIFNPGHEDTGWFGPDYKWVRLIATDQQPRTVDAHEILINPLQDIPNGTYNVVIELQDGGDTLGDLWIDNVAVMATPVNHIIKPIATLLPTGTLGERHFAVGATNESLDLRVYTGPEYDAEGNPTVVDTEGETDPFTDARLFTVERSNAPYPLRWDQSGAGFGDGYYSGSVMQLDRTSNTWEQYGDPLAFTTGVDFLGFTASTNFNIRTQNPWFATWSADSAISATNSAFGNYLYGMPSNELYMLEDLAIGTNQVEWVALQHATSDWVDIDGDDVNDQFDIHPWIWAVPQPYWNVENTILDIRVTRWNPFVSPLSWQDGEFISGHPDADHENFPEGALSHAYTNAELISSGGQEPTIAWTQRTTGGSYTDTAALRYEGIRLREDGTVGPSWETLGATPSVQNNQNWGAAVLTDMIVGPQDFPIVGYLGGHMFSQSVRQFRREVNIPNMVITETSGSANDNVLEFGTTTTQVVDQSLNIRNTGTGDLIIYGIEMGGLGDLGSNPFSLLNAPAFPFTLSGTGAGGLNQGEDASIGVRFNPTGVAAGEYYATLLVQSNEVNRDHATHPFAHFYEVSMRVEVLNRAEIVVTPEVLNYGTGTVIGTTSAPQEVEIRNTGTANLTLSEWFFDGANYRIPVNTAAELFAYVTTTDLAGTEIITPVSSTNYVGAADDVVLVPNSTLTLMVVFEPDTRELTSQTLFIHSDDSDEEITAVALAGAGQSGAVLLVEQDSVIIPNDGDAEFGSVIVGGAPGVIELTITNNGTTPLTLTSISKVGALPEITLNPPFVRNAVLPAGGELVLTITYAPTEAETLNAFITIVNDSSNVDERIYNVHLVGLAVNEEPIIDIRENSGIPNNNELVFDAINVGGSQQITFQIGNVGGAPLRIERFAFLDGTDYRIDPTNPPGATGDVTIPYGGAPVVFTVTFTPTSDGEAPDTLQIFWYDAQNRLTFTEVDLSGFGLDRALLVTDTQGNDKDRRIDFGDVGVNQASVQHQIVLRNTGNSPLTITGWTLDGGLDEVFEVDAFTGAVVLPAGEQRVIGVNFAPEAVGDYSDSVTVTSNDPDAPSWTVTLLGTAVSAGEVTVIDPNGNTGDITIDFTPGDPIMFGIESVEKTFVIRNTGGSDLVIKGLAVSSTYFIIDEPLSLSNVNDDVVLSMGEEYEVTVTFAPPSFYDGIATLAIITSDIEDNDNDTITTVRLQGQAIYAPQLSSTSPFSRWTDSSGNMVNVILVGGGTAAILPESGGSSPNSDIGRIVLNGTTDRSFLIVMAPRGTTIGSISGGSLGSLLLSNVVLDGAGIDLNSIGRMLLVGDLTNGADIQVDNVLSSSVMVRAGNIGNGSDVSIPGNVSFFMANSFGDGTFTANSVSNFFMGRGGFDATVRVNGNLGNVFLQGSSATGKIIAGGNISMISGTSAMLSGAINANRIGTVQFGSFNGASISAAESITRVSGRGDLVDSLILGGYDLGDDGELGGVGGAADTLFAGGQVGSVSISGRIQGSYVSAGIAPVNGNFLAAADTVSGSIGRVSFGGRINTGTPFGVSATTRIDSVRLGNLTLNPGDTDGDFEVRML